MFQCVIPLSSSFHIRLHLGQNARSGLFYENIGVDWAGNEIHSRNGWYVDTRGDCVQVPAWGEEPGGIM